MSNKPLISIVTVSFQAEANIEETVDSVLNQTYQNIEYIFKDGNSKDNTNKIIKKYEDKLMKRNIKTQHIICQDTGIYNAMNQALQYCNGEYIIFLNSGDTFFSCKILDEIFSNMNFENSDIIYGDTDFVDVDMHFLWKGDINTIKDKCPFCHQSAFIKREWMEQHKFDESLMITADYDFIYKSYIEKAKFLYVEKIISCFKRGGVSGTRLIQDRKEHHLVQLRYNEKEEKEVFRYLRYIYTLINAFLQELAFKIMPQDVSIFLRHFNKKRKMQLINSRDNGGDLHDCGKN